MSPNPLSVIVYDILFSVTFSKLLTTSSTLYPIPVPRLNDFIVRFQQKLECTGTFACTSKWLLLYYSELIYLLVNLGQVSNNSSNLLNITNSSKSYSFISISAQISFNLK